MRAVVGYIDRLEHQLETERAARQRAELKLKAAKGGSSRPSVRSAPAGPREEALRVLGLTGDPSAEEIRRAYRERARDTHPDTAGGDAEKFQEVKRAMETLLD